MEQMARWLQLELKEQPEDSALRPHLQAVWKYVRSGTKGDNETSK